MLKSPIQRGNISPSPLWSHRLEGDGTTPCIYLLVWWHSGWQKERDHRTGLKGENVVFSYSYFIFPDHSGDRFMARLSLDAYIGDLLNNYDVPMSDWIENKIERKSFLQNLTSVFLYQIVVLTLNIMMALKNGGKKIRRDYITKAISKQQMPWKLRPLNSLSIMKQDRAQCGLEDMSSSSQKDQSD